MLYIGPSIHPVASNDNKISTKPINPNDDLDRTGTTFPTVCEDASPDEDESNESLDCSSILSPTSGSSQKNHLISNSESPTSNLKYVYDEKSDNFYNNKKNGILSNYSKKKVSNSDSSSFSSPADIIISYCTFTDIVPFFYFIFIYLF
jgi:hypothetical protein